MAKDYAEIRNAWSVESRLSGDGKEWERDVTFPSYEIIEYDGEKIQSHHDTIDIGKGRAYVHANWLTELHGPDIETRVSFVGRKPWRIKDGEDPRKEFLIKARYNSCLV